MIGGVSGGRDLRCTWSVFVTDPQGHHCEVYWATGRPHAAPRPLSPDTLTRPEKSAHGRVDAEAPDVS